MGASTAIKTNRQAGSGAEYRKKRDHKTMFERELLALRCVALRCFAILYVMLRHVRVTYVVVAWHGMARIANIISYRIAFGFDHTYYRIRT